MSGLVCIQGDWSEVVWRWFGVVWWWFGANMAGLRNTNAFKFILQVFILSQKHILSVKKVVWCGLDVVWGDFEVVWGGLGCFHGPWLLLHFLNLNTDLIASKTKVKNSQNPITLVQKYCQMGILRMIGIHQT